MNKRMRGKTKMKLTGHQKKILGSGRFNIARGYAVIHAGRYGWNTAHVRALAAKGLLTKVFEGPWDSSWRLTDAGKYELACLESEAANERAGF